MNCWSTQMQTGMGRLSSALVEFTLWHALSCPGGSRKEMALLGLLTTKGSCCLQSTNRFLNQAAESEMCSCRSSHCIQGLKILLPYSVSCALKGTSDTHAPQHSRHHTGDCSLRQTCVGTMSDVGSSIHNVISRAPTNLKASQCHQGTKTEQVCACSL